jgi:hypothetical protein
MRLLHYRPEQDPPLNLVEFAVRDVPKYAILSHTWEQEEVTFKEMKKGQANKKKGYQKIVDFCKVARGGGFEYMWVDTCCGSPIITLSI